MFHNLIQAVETQCLKGRLLADRITCAALLQSDAHSGGFSMCLAMLPPLPERCHIHDVLAALNRDCLGRL